MDTRTFPALSLMSALRRAEKVLYSTSGLALCSEEHNEGKVGRSSVCVGGGEGRRMSSTVGQTTAQSGATTLLTTFEEL